MKWNPAQEITTPTKLIDLGQSVSQPQLKTFFQYLGSPLEQLFSFEGVNEIYRGVRREYPRDQRFFSACARALDLRLDVEPDDIQRIPAAGGVLVVANHPFGALDAIGLGDILGRVRSDVKVMANGLLARMPETAGEIISVNPFGGKAAKRQNLKGMKDAVQWLREGGVLMVFPAGEVSHYHVSKGRVTDPAWSRHVAQLAFKTRVPVLPVYFHGQNSLLFQLSGVIHPRLRTLMLPREVMAKKRTPIRLVIGKPLPFSAWRYLDQDGEATHFFRSATYALAHRTVPDRKAHQGGALNSVACIAEQDLGYLAELRGGAGEVLVTQGKLEVRLCESEDFPATLNEIGRLREVSFRAVEEGSGQARDLDRFDAYYRQLVLWNRETGEIMGGYRLGLTDEIMALRGIKGLYTASLFKLKREFFLQHGAAIELGRSFVVPGHQRSYSALSLLWKGIGAFVVNHPGYVHLFGPVSISADYHPLSQNLIIQYLRKNASAPEMGRWVKPSHPPQIKKDGELKEISRWLDNVDEVSALVSYLEHDSKGVPVLLRQYLKMNARLLSFSVDHDFANVLDGLMLTDLRQVDRPLLNRFLGNAGAAAYLDFHERRNSMGQN